MHIHQSEEYWYLDANGPEIFLNVRRASSTFDAEFLSLDAAPTDA